MSSHSRSQNTASYRIIPEFRGNAKMDASTKEFHRRMQALVSEAKGKLRQGECRSSLVLLFKGAWTNFDTEIRNAVCEPNADPMLSALCTKWRAELNRFAVRIDRQALRERRLMGGK